MSSIRVKSIEGKNKFNRNIIKYVECDVSDSNCKYRECLVVGRWTTQSKNNNYTQRDKRYSCMTRNYHGCPDDRNKFIDKTPKYILKQFEGKHGF